MQGVLGASLLCSCLELAHSVVTYAMMQAKYICRNHCALCGMHDDVSTVWLLGGVRRTHRPPSISKSRNGLRCTPLQHQSGHAAPTNICACPRIVSDIDDVHCPIYPCSRCPPRSQWHLGPYPGPLLRKTFSASGPRTSQRSKRRAWKTVRSQEEWRCVSSTRRFVRQAWLTAMQESMLSQETSSSANEAQRGFPARTANSVAITASLLQSLVMSGTTVTQGNTQRDSTLVSPLRKTTPFHIHQTRQGGDD